MNYVAEVFKRLNNSNKTANVSSKRKFDSMDQVDNQDDGVAFMGSAPKKLKKQHKTVEERSKPTWSYITDWFSNKIPVFVRRAAERAIKPQPVMTQRRSTFSRQRPEIEMSRPKRWRVASLNTDTSSQFNYGHRDPLHNNDNQNEVYNPFASDLKTTSKYSTQLQIPLIDIGGSDDENNSDVIYEPIDKKLSSKSNKSTDSHFLSLSKGNSSRVEKKRKRSVMKSKFRKFPQSSPNSSANQSHRFMTKEQYQMLLKSQSNGEHYPDEDPGLNSVSVETQTLPRKPQAFFKVNLTDRAKLNEIKSNIEKNREIQIQMSPWDVKQRQNEGLFKVPVSKVPVLNKSDFDTKKKNYGHTTTLNSSFRSKSTKEEPDFSQSFKKQRDISITPTFQPTTSKFVPSNHSDSDIDKRIGRRSEGYASSSSSTFLYKPSIQRSQSFRLHRLESDLFSEEWLKSLKHNVEKSKKTTSEKVEDEEKRYQALQKEKEKKLFEANRKAVEKIESKFSTLYLNKYVDNEIEEDDDYQLPILTPDMESEIDRAMQPNPASEVLTQGFGINITRKDIETLAGLNWLNDEIINFYTNMLMERGKEKNYPSCYSFNTFFYPKLISSGHAALRRWTRKVDIFSYDLLLVPVHLGMHWCLAVIDFRHKKIQYYDSMGGINNECLNALKNYLAEESRDKRKIEFDMSDWKLEAVKNIPQQMNGSDCGMFTCKFAEYITRNAKITFTQRNMPYFRRRMVFEIIKKKLL